MNTKKVGIIGGDMRQYFLAKSLKKDGNDVKFFGFENLPNKTEQLSECSLKELAEFSEYIILPLPVSRDGKTLNAPFSREKIELKNLHDNLKNKKIFGGIISPEIKSLFDEDSKIYDFCREDFSILNAVPTAEGAIKEVFENSDKISILSIAFESVQKEPHITNPKLSFFIIFPPLQFCILLF